MTQKPAFHTAGFFASDFVTSQILLGLGTEFRRRIGDSHRQKIHLPQGLKLLNDVGVKFNGLHVLEEMGVRRRVGQLANRALVVHLLQHTCGDN